jgi:ABC-type transport system involved in cytochrome c biogenesis permease subunit
MTLNIIITTGFGIGLTGLILIACSVAALLLTIKKETTRLDHILYRLIVLGFLAFVIGLIIFIAGLIL